MLRPALAVATALLLAVAAAPSWSANLLVNPGFERDSNGDGVPDGWQVEIHTSEGAEGTIVRDTKVRHSGSASVRIEHTSQAGWVRISQFDIPARPNTTYRFSAWVRGKGRFLCALYEFVKTKRGQYKTHRVVRDAATDQWRQVTATVSTGKDAAKFKLSLITDSPATVWFDDVELSTIASAPSVLVPSVAQPPKLDGDLSDPAWQKAVEVTVQFVLGGGGKLAPVRTRAWMARDAENFYVAFECQEPLADKLPKAQDIADRSVWSLDRAEVFLMGRDSYVHIGVSPSGPSDAERAFIGRMKLYPNWHAMPGSQTKLGKPKFECAAKIGEGKWTAEIAVPLKEVGELRPAEPWRGQLCRVRLVTGQEEDFVWSYTPGDRFAKPKHFACLTFEAPAAQKPREVSLRKRPAARPVVVPTPQKLQWRDGRLRLADGMAIVLPAGAEGRQLTGPQQLADDLKTRFGIRAAVAARRRSGRPLIFVGWKGHLPPGLPRKLSGTGLSKPEGYVVEVDGRSAVAIGADERGAFYAVQTLRQLLSYDADGPYLPCCRIDDWPETKIRGWHCASPYSPQSIGDWKRAIDAWAALKYNLVVLEVNGRMKYESYPDLGSGLTKDQMRDLVRYCRERYLEPVPQLATFGHFPYVLRKKKYRHLGERFQKPDGTWAYSDWNYCPSNPEVYKLVFALMDELIEVFQPRYFHIGHDEASFGPIGTCEKCRQKKPWELWAEDVNKLHDYLAGKGLRVMLWAEQFLEHRNGAAPYWTARALPLIPRDLIMCHWEYSARHEQPDIKFFMDHGFETLGCPWYWPENVYYMASEVHRYGALGFLGTTWYGIDRVFNERAWLEGAWVLGAENSWTPNKPHIDHIDYSTLAKLREIAFGWRRRAPRRWAVVDLRPYCNETTVAGRDGGWVGLGPKYDLRNIKPGLRWVAGVPVMLLDGRKGPSCVMLADAASAGQLPTRTWRMAVGLKARALYFLHTTSLPDPRPGNIYARNLPGRLGEYVVHYADGTSASVELVYWRNIDDWNSQLGPAQACGAIHGHTDAGAWVTLGLWRWENPQPDEEIVGVEMASAEAAARPILLAITAELR